MNLADIYLESQARLTALADDLTGDDAEATVPASPAWTVRDTYAHLVGVAVDVMAKRLEGAGSDAWTAAQVRSRADRTLDEVVQEWATVVRGMAAMIASHPDELWRFVGGTWLHEQDIRAAVGLRGLRHTDGGEVALGLVDAIGPRMSEARLPPLIIETGDRRWVLGEADTTGRDPLRLEIDAYELARAVGGRRSIAQMSAYPWSRDPSAHLPFIATYGPTPVDLQD